MIEEGKGKRGEGREKSWFRFARPLEKGGIEGRKGKKGEDVSITTNFIPCMTRKGGIRGGGNQKRGKGRPPRRYDAAVTLILLTGMIAIGGGGEGERGKREKKKGRGEKKIACRPAISIVSRAP